MVAPDTVHRDRLQQYMRQKLAMEKWSKLQFGAADEVKEWLGRYAAPAHDPSKVSGYNVESIFEATESAQDQAYRSMKLRQGLR